MDARHQKNRIAPWTARWVLFIISGGRYPLLIDVDTARRAHTPPFFGPSSLRASPAPLPASLRAGRRGHTELGPPRAPRAPLFPDHAPFELTRFSSAASGESSSRQARTYGAGAVFARFALGLEAMPERHTPGRKNSHFWK